MNDDELIITLKDLRRMQYCSSGARYWFQRHGLDWSDFLRNGIPASKMLATNDALGVGLVEFVKHGK